MPGMQLPRALTQAHVSPLNVFSFCPFSWYFNYTSLDFYVCVRILGPSINSPPLSICDLILENFLTDGQDYLYFFLYIKSMEEHFGNMFTAIIEAALDRDIVFTDTLKRRLV